MFRLILFAPSSYTGTFDRCDKILQHKNNIEIYTPAQKGIIKAITGYATENQHKLRVFKVDWQGWGTMAYDECFKGMVEYADAAIIFTDGESKLAYKLEVLCAAKPIPVRVIRYEKAVKERKRPIKAVCHIGVVSEPVRDNTITGNGDRLIKPPLSDSSKLSAPVNPAGIKSAIHEAIDEAIAADKLTNKKRRKITVPLSAYAKQRYKEAHKKWFMRTNTHAWNDGFYTPPKIPVINSGSRGSSFIVQFLEWQGWDATVVSTTGRQLPGGKWIKGTTKIGSQDVFATINGKSCKFEVKHSTDTPKPDQLSRQAKAISSGGISEFIYTKNFDYFFEIYDKIIGSHK